MIKLKDIVENKQSVNKDIDSILKELVEENLSVDLEPEDLETVLQIEITNDIIEQIKELITNKADTWDYFNIMKILTI